MTKNEISVGSGLKAIIEDLLHCPAVELVVNGAIGGGNGVGGGCDEAEVSYFKGLPFEVFIKAF